MKTLNIPFTKVMLSLDGSGIDGWNRT